MLSHAILAKRSQHTHAPTTSIVSHVHQQSPPPYAQQQINAQAIESVTTSNQHLLTKKFNLQFRAGASFVR